MGFEALFCLLVMLVFPAYVVVQPDLNVCIPGPGNTTGHQLPRFPQQFKVQIHGEISGTRLKEYIYSMQAAEIYDETANLGFLQIRYGGDIPKGVINNAKYYYDYIHGQYYTVYDHKTELNHQTCVTNELNNQSHVPYGYDHGHILSAQDIFKFGEKYNETFVREMHHADRTSDSWTACIYDEATNTTSKIDMYFDSERAKRPKLPMRIEVWGSGPLTPNITDDPQRQTWHQLYKFENPQIGQQDRTDFFPPVGVMCPGRVNVKNVPKIPGYFTLNVEIVMPFQEKIYYTKEFYHLAEKIVAYEIQAKSNPNRPMRQIHDFNTGISYTIGPTGRCDVRPIPIDSDDAKSPDDEHVAMRSPASFFALHSPDVSWIYEGWTMTRDARITAWQTNRYHWKPLEWRKDTDAVVNSTWAYFFLDDGWIIEPSPGGKSNGVLPIRLEIDWVAHNKEHQPTPVHRGKEIHNFFQPYEGFVEPYYFDVSACYSHLNESLQLALNLEGKDTYNKYYVNNTKHFTHGVIVSLAASIDVSRTRITHLKVVEGYKGFTTIFFTLLDRPRVQGDSLNATDPGPKLTVVHSLLDKLVNGKEGSMLVLEFTYNEGRDVGHVTATSSTLREETEPLVQTKLVGLSNGVVSGISIGTFLLGAVIALISAYVVFKYKSREVPYSIQE